MFIRIYPPSPNLANAKILTSSKRRIKQELKNTFGKTSDVNILRDIQKEGGKLAMRLAAAFMDAGSKARDALLNYNYYNAAQSLQPTTTLGYVVTALTLAGVSLAVIGRFRRYILKKGSTKSITNKYKSGTSKKPAAKLPPPAKMLLSPNPKSKKVMENKEIQKQVAEIALLVENRTVTDIKEGLKLVVGFTKTAGSVALNVVDAVTASQEWAVTLAEKLLKLGTNVYYLIYLGSKGLMLKGGYQLVQIVYDILVNGFCVLKHLPGGLGPWDLAKAGGNILIDCGMEGINKAWQVAVWTVTMVVAFYSSELLNFFVRSVTIYTPKFKKTVKEFQGDHIHQLKVDAAKQKKNLELQKMKHKSQARSKAAKIQIAKKMEALHKVEGVQEANIQKAIDHAQNIEQKSIAAKAKIKLNKQIAKEKAKLDKQKAKDDLKAKKYLYDLQYGG
jgi:hypothetical protein